MDAEIFICNVKAKCKERNTTPTVACKESGAGKNLISNLKNGTFPSIERVGLLASYLGCSIDDLTGEKKEPTTVSSDGQAQKLAKILRDVGVDVDNLSVEQMRRLGKIIKAAMEE